MKKVKALTVPEGDGVVVKRLMPVHGLMNFDPFVLMDHFNIEGGGFPDHPHRGFEGLTYMLDGEVMLNQECLKTAEAGFFDRDEKLSLIAKGKSRLTVCFGKPHGAPIYQHGPFVD